MSFPAIIVVIIIAGKDINRGNNMNKRIIFAILIAFVCNGLPNTIHAEENPIIDACFASQSLEDIINAQKIGLKSQENLLGLILEKNPAFMSNFENRLARFDQNLNSFDELPKNDAEIAEKISQSAIDENYGVEKCKTLYPEQEIICNELKELMRKRFLMNVTINTFTLNLLLENKLQLEHTNTELHKKITDYRDRSFLFGGNLSEYFSKN